MVLLGDEAKVEACFGPFGGSANVDEVQGFAPNVPYAQKLIWTHPMVLLGDEAHVEARFVPFGDGANLDAR
jgi:hypothetical protein